jgi:hypothetical protein
MSASVDAVTTRSSRSPPRSTSSTGGKKSLSRGFRTIGPSWWPPKRLSDLHGLAGPYIGLGVEPELFLDPLTFEYWTIGSGGSASSGSDGSRRGLVANAATIGT